MSLIPLLQLAAGLLFLFAGGEAFIAGATRLAKSLGTPPIVIGLTVVSLGTSAPELATALVGIGEQGTPLVLGNVVGSNIFNLLVVLGACALVVPMRVSRRLIRRDLPVLLITTLAVWGMAAGGRLLMPAGVALLAALAINVVWEFVTAREQQAAQHHRIHGERSGKPFGWIGALVLLAGGVGLLVGGSEFLISGAKSTARLLEVDETVVGLTLVAAGTSLPELVTSLVAAYRRQADLAIGNVVGSSLINLLLILGVAILYSGPAGLDVPPVLLQRDIPVLVVVTLICLPLLWSYATMTSTDGALLLLLYVIYLGEQVVLAKLPTALGIFRMAVLVGIVPVAAFLVWSVVSWCRAAGHYRSDRF